MPTSGWGGAEGEGDDGLLPKLHPMSHGEAEMTPEDGYDDGAYYEEPRSSSPTRRNEVASLSLALAAPAVSANAAPSRSHSHDVGEELVGGGVNRGGNKLLSASGRPTRARSKTAAARHKRRNEDRERHNLPAAQSLQSELHTVAPGDTLNVISSVYGVSVAVIQRLNDLHPDSIIYPGDVLRVPSPLHATTHTVAPGDTLNLISSVYGMPVESIEVLNGITPDSVIHPGTVLRLASPHVRGGRRRQRKHKTGYAATASGAPVPTAFGTVRCFAGRVARFLPSAPEHFFRYIGMATRTLVGATQAPRWRPNFRRERPAEGHVEVQRGESLASLAQDFGLSIRSLQKMNGITSDMIEPGEVLRVTPLTAAERNPHLRRRTKRHLFQRSADNGVGSGESRDGEGRGAEKVRKANHVWRRWRWRWEPRGCEGDAFFGRRSGYGRGARNNEKGTGGEIKAAKATAAAALGKDSCGEPVILDELQLEEVKLKPQRVFTWDQRRRPRDQTHRWHPRFGNPVVDNDPFVSSGFGMRWERMHWGVDVAANEGTPIRVAAAGVVKERTFDENGYGWLLKVDHGDGWETRYAHCWEIKARPGQKLRKGQEVALVGNTGRSFGPHLHFEVRRGGEAIDPLVCTAV